MSSEVDKLASSIRQLVATPEVEQNELDYVQPLLQTICQLFLADLNYAIKHQMDSLMWKTIKELVDKMRRQKAELAENVISVGIFWMCDVAQKVQLNYKLHCPDMPEFIRVSEDLLQNRERRTVRNEIGRRFVCFICLRLGDLFRYKNRLEEAGDFYKKAVRSNPRLGDGWNQLGVMAQLKVNLTDVLYYASRATHSPLPFPSASANIIQLLKKYSGNEDLPDTSTFAEQYLTVVSRCHFMLPVSDALITRVGSQLTQVRLIVPVLTILQPLGWSKDELEVKRRLTKLLQCAYRSICDKLTERIDPVTIWSFCLLRRVTEICHEKIVFVDSLNEKAHLFLNDTFYLEHFRCFPDPFEYPVSYGQIAEHIQETEQEKEEKSGRGAPSLRRTLLRAPPPL